MTARESATSSTECALIMQMQRAWVSRRRLTLRPTSAALIQVSDALFMPLDRATRSQFAAGAGGELNRMASLRSSSALAVNVFLPWKPDPSVLGQLLGSSSCTGMEFEVQLPTGVGRRHPHLDVIMDAVPAPLAVESKFLEPYDQPKPQQMSQAYLRESGLWEGMPGLKQLAQKIAEDGMTFERLGAAQLIKHVLGLTRRYGPGGFRLVYLWYLVAGRSARTHESELERFSEAAHGEVDFVSLTYQDLFTRMTKRPEPIPGYLAYLADRYFQEVE